MPSTLLVPNPRSQDQTFCSHSMLAIAKIVLALSFLSVAPFQLPLKHSLKDLTENDVFVRKGRLTIDVKRALDGVPSSLGGLALQDTSSHSSFSNLGYNETCKNRKQSDDHYVQNSLSLAPEGGNAEGRRPHMDPILTCKGLRFDKRTSPHGLMQNTGNFGTASCRIATPERRYSSTRTSSKGLPQQNYYSQGQ